MTDHTAGHLARLEDLDDVKVADGYNDVRGWDVRSADGQKVGEVKHLIADPAAMRVRYLEVELDDSVRAGATSNDRRALLPIGAVRLDDDRDDVIVDSLASAQFGGLPTYAEGTPISRGYETSLRERFTAGGAAAAGAAGLAAASTGASRSSDDFYEHDAYNEDRFRAGRSARGTSTDDTTRRMTLSEEQLAIGKQQVQAGEVALRKTVETEHVQETVDLRREEVTVDRRPLSADTATNATIGEGEIRVPVMEEQAVVEKRMVPTEEIVIKKRMVQEHETVEADLRRERVVYDEDNVSGRADRAQASGFEDRATDSGLGDRLADKADDLKDRFDGNPRSKPGPDATDSRI